MYHSKVGCSGLITHCDLYTVNAQKAYRYIVSKYGKCLEYIILYVENNILYQVLINAWPKPELVEAW